MPLLPPFPAHRRVVLDTYNEVDDQFALAHLLLSPETITVEAVHAAPFFNDRSTSPADGMEKSYAEILRVLDLVQPSVRPPVFRGSSHYLPAPGQPVESPAARDLIQRALSPASNPLYVIAIGAITNVASALLFEPKIAEKIVVIWLGGHAPFWPDNREFNLQQDVWGAQVLLGSNAPLGLIPCYPVASQLIVTVPTGKISRPAKYSRRLSHGDRARLCGQCAGLVESDLGHCRQRLDHQSLVGRSGRPASA